MPETAKRATHIVEEQQQSEKPVARPNGLPLWLKGVAPLGLLAILVVALFRFGPLGVFRQAFPPVEELTIERVTLPRPGLMRVHVVNGGPEPVTIAQVLVDDATWAHSVDGNRTVERLARRTLDIPYPWVEGEPHMIRLITSTGLTFDAQIAVATQTPQPDARFVGTFAMLGIYVGVIPVFLGLLWLPFLRSIQRRWLDFFLSLTIGLLAFLGVDAAAEAIDTSAAVPGAFQGLGLVAIGIIGTPLLIAALGEWRKRRNNVQSAIFVSLLISVAIGLHNLGEGLAIGAAYSTGEIALGTFLVLGFLLHNTTEGLGIVAPLARERPRPAQLVLLGLVAGAPTVLGTWIGGFTYSPIWTTLFFAVGAGAIIQVIHALSQLFGRQTERGLTAPLNAAGVLAGLLLMYVTGVLVTA